MKPVVGFIPTSVVYAPMLFLRVAVAVQHVQHPVSVGVLATAVYLTDSPTLAKLTSWSHEAPNEPLRELVLIGPSVGGAWFVGGVVPDLGYLRLEVPGTQFEAALRDGLRPGGILPGEWVWARLGTALKLVRVGSVEHTIAASQTRPEKGRKPLKPRDLVPGQVYLDHRRCGYLYLGEVATVAEQGAVWSTPKPVFSRHRGPAYLEFRHAPIGRGEDVSLADLRGVPGTAFRLHCTPRPANLYEVAPVRRVSAVEAVEFARAVLDSVPLWAADQWAKADLARASTLLLRSTTDDPLTHPVDPAVFRRLSTAYMSVFGAPPPVELTTDPLSFLTG